MSANLSHLSGKKGVRAGIFRDLVSRSRAHTLGREDFRALSETTLFGKASLYGTASFYDPLTPISITKGLKKYFEDKPSDSVSKIRGRISF